VSSLLSWFLSPWGLLVLAALDSSLVFFLPLANDAVLVYLAASDRAHFWAYPLIATAGSAIGAFTTYSAGRWISEEGLERWVSKARLARIRRSVNRTGAFALAVPALIPPPFPYTPFVLTSGALEVNPWTFFSVLAGMRFTRFMAEAVLADIYGERLVGWMQSEPFRLVVWAFVALAVAGSAWSIHELIGKTRGIGTGRRGRHRSGRR
jgi:membrane protein YqaA with SNARE-associated domain